eukprot:NODE_1979_length_1235_cov_5.981450_g1643_i0.p1 GENE.NODE_1979_length_1235_cov_5.981450_g1643_i0~~NODE_1979_length_1235_cov_5.981450_g1643_i0.p1  ORF type:complete len:370 (-),score=91.47 NODE_1979_length_1235_cov_5.981450_g1643_i0:126-1073(-)
MHGSMFFQCNSTTTPTAGTAGTQELHSLLKTVLENGAAELEQANTQAEHLRTSLPVEEAVKAEYVGKLNAKGCLAPSRIAVYWLSVAFRRGDGQVLDWLFNEAFGKDALLEINGELPGWLATLAAPTTVLHIAVKYRYIDIINTLLDLGADPNVANGMGRTPLHVLCCGTGNDEAGGGTTLGTCVLAPSSEVCSVLVDRGADPNLRDAHGYTPLQFASQSGLVSIISVLLTKNPTPPYQAADVNATQPDDNDKTALHYAAVRGRAGVAARLIESGADVNAKSADGSAPLDLATNREVGKVLQDNGGKANRGCIVM